MALKAVPLISDAELMGDLPLAQDLTIQAFCMNLPIPEQQKEFAKIVKMWLHRNLFEFLRSNPQIEFPLTDEFRSFELFLRGNV